MLVWLAEYLVAFYSGFNVFSYLTFRAIVSLLTALFLSLCEFLFSNANDAHDAQMQTLIIVNKTRGVTLPWLWLPLL